MYFYQVQNFTMYLLVPLVHLLVPLVCLLVPLVTFVPAVKPVTLIKT
jgi:hypothetical protein